MILIVAKMKLKQEFVEEFPSLVAPFSAATRAEEGCLFFEFSRSIEEPDTYTLIEGFRDGQAGGEHVGSEHFKLATEAMPRWLAEVPKIIYVEAPVDGWQAMAEMRPE